MNASRGQFTVRENDTVILDVKYNRRQHHLEFKFGPDSYYSYDTPIDGNKMITLVKEALTSVYPFAVYGQEIGVDYEGDTGRLNSSQVQIQISM